MERVLSLQKLSEHSSEAMDEMISTISNVCSDETTACSTQSNQCKTTDTASW